MPSTPQGFGAPPESLPASSAERRTLHRPSPSPSPWTSRVPCLIGRMHGNMCLYIYKYVYVCVCMIMYVCTYVSIYIYILLQFEQIQKRGYVHANIYIYKYIYLCVCACAYV